MEGGAGRRWGAPSRLPAYFIDTAQIAKQKMKAAFLQISERAVFRAGDTDYAHAICRRFQRRLCVGHADFAHHEILNHPQQHNGER